MTAVRAHDPAARPALRTRIFSRANGGGLMRDLRLVSGVLAGAGHAVEPVAFGKEKGLRNLRLGGMWLAGAWRGRVDVQIALEHMYPRSFALAPRNLLVPNPEWFRADYHASLRHIDVMLCKTPHAMRIFSGLGCEARYVGFTSEDRRDPSVPRRREFLHLAGRSPVKGTGVVLEAWRRHPEWPRLVVVQSARNARPGGAGANVDYRVGRMDDAALLELQNACLFHICPSEAEGFGHCLVEGLSVGAINLTTDGTPMNEVVGPECGVLITPVRTGLMGLATRYGVDVRGVEDAVEQVLAMDAAALAEMSRRARARFESMDGGFRARFPRIVAEAVLAS